MPPSPLVFLGFFAISTPLLASAQNAFAINKIDIPRVDNGTATITAGNSFLSFVNATVADGFVSSVRSFSKCKGNQYAHMAAGAYW